VIAPDLLTGAIVAGGHARRLGGLAKGLISVDGEPIMTRQLRLLGARCAATLVVGDPAGPYADLGAPVYPDQFPGRGPPGGVHTALVRAHTPWVMVLGCDLPYITGAVLDGLRALGSHDVCIYRADGRHQPLVSCWRRAVEPTLAAMLAAGSPGFAEIISKLDVRVIEAPGAAFFNVNTPAELARIRGG